MRILAAALVAAFFMAAPAAAQIFPRTMRVPCSDPGVLPDVLVRDYGEVPAEQGIANGALVQLWRNAETGSWTILLISPDGTVCALASGEDWMKAAAPPLEGL
jgi:hypothetical protein